MTKPKLNKISVVMRHGQMISNVARNGTPKKLTVPAPAHGMRRQTTTKLHPYLHGQAVNDETCDKLHLQGRAVPVHPGMTTKQVAKIHPVANNASAVLEEAGRLGRPKE